jgi:hypothetical protein
LPFQLLVQQWAPEATGVAAAAAAAAAVALLAAAAYPLTLLLYPEHPWAASPAADPSQLHLLRRPAQQQQSKEIQNS